MQRGHELLLPTGVAVGDEDHLTLRARPHRPERLEDARAHLGAAARAARLEPADRALLLRRRAGDGIALVAVGAVAELDQLEAIGLAERGDEAPDDPLGLRERRAVHGSAGVEQDDEIARDRREPSVGRGRDDGEQTVGVVRVRRRGHRPGGAHGEADLGRGHRPAHHDVAVEARALERRELDRAVALGAQRVRRRLDAPAARDRVAHGELEVDAGGDPLGRDLDADVARVLGRVGRREVARPDHRGETELPLARREPGEALVDRDPRDEALARREVADLLGEDVGAALLEERRGLAGDERLLEALARAGLRVDAPGDRAPADLEGVAAHGAVGGQGHAVGDAKRLVVGVLERLLEDGARDAASGADAQRRPDERQRAPVVGDELGAAQGVVRGGALGHAVGRGAERRGPG